MDCRGGQQCGMNEFWFGDVPSEVSVGLGRYNRTAGKACCGQRSSFVSLVSATGTKIYLTQQKLLWKWHSYTELFPVILLF